MLLLPYIKQVTQPINQDGTIPINIVRNNQFHINKSLPWTHESLYLWLPCNFLITYVSGAIFPWESLY